MILAFRWSLQALPNTGCEPNLDDVFALETNLPQLYANKYKYN
jgi:hypothetical protein